MMPLCFTMQLGCMRVHRVYASCFFFEVWIHHTKNSIIIVKQTIDTIDIIVMYNIRVPQQ